MSLLRDIHKVIRNEFAAHCPRIPKMRIVKKTITISTSVHIQSAQTKIKEKKSMAKLVCKGKWLHHLVNA